MSIAVASDELTDQQRAMVQLSQADKLTMSGHIRKKLRIGREYLARTRGTNPPAEAEDDMQVLARDINFPTPDTPTRTAKWPLAAAIALGLGVPATTGVVMAPQIINAFLGDAPAVESPVVAREYVPILLPGKPQ